MTRFDWYQATIYAPDPTYHGLGMSLMAAWELSDLVQDRGMHGYTQGARIVRGETTLCRLWWGGNPGVNVTSSGEEAPVLAAALKRLGLSYGVTRGDACADWIEEGCFDSLSAHLMQYAKDNGITINQQGDWVRGQARTLYLGSPQSPIRICLYEKGYEQRSKVGGDAPLDWTRLEVRVKPKSNHRMAVAGWEPSEFFSAGWVADALAVLGWNDLQKRAVGTVWKPSDDERSRSVLCRQYGAVMERWASEAGGWDALGVSFKSLMDELRSRDQSAKKAVPASHRID